jgi:hypothetical protein
VNDPEDATIPDAGTPAPEPSATERLTGQAKPAKAPKATKPKAPKATATTATGDDEEPADIPVVVQGPAERTYRVHCPKDRTMPAREVSAVTPADAKERYCADLGIITPGHPLVAAAVN